MSQRTSLGVGEQRGLFNAILACHDINDEAHFKHYVQNELSNIIPHGRFSCGFGATADYKVLALINFNFPEDYIRSIVDAKGVIHSYPILAWRQSGNPQFINSRNINKADQSWREAFMDNGLKNVGGHGVTDYHRACGAYFGFGDLERPWDATQAYLLEILVPHLYMVAQSITLDAAKNPVIPPPPKALPALSPREREVLQWVAVGKSSWDIGMILGISAWTVKVHIRHAMRKLNVYTRSHAVALAIQYDLISP